MHKRRVIGAAIAVLALLAGMFSAPAASAGVRAAQEDVYCFLTPPEPSNDVLRLTAVYDLNGELFSVAGGWHGIFQCSSLPTQYVQQATLSYFFVYNDSWAIRTGQTKCALVDGATSCDRVDLGDHFECEGIECAGEYFVRYRADVAMAPGVVATDLPDYCTQVQPPPLQVLECLGDSNSYNFPARLDG